MLIRKQKKTTGTGISQTDTDSVSDFSVISFIPQMATYIFMTHRDNVLGLMLMIISYQWQGLTDFMFLSTNCVCSENALSFQAVVLIIA